MNPDRMRSTYGLLVYMLMDSAEAPIQELLEFPCVRPLRTVYTRLGPPPPPPSSVSSRLVLPSRLVCRCLNVPSIPAVSGDIPGFGQETCSQFAVTLAAGSLCCSSDALVPFTAAKQARGDRAKAHAATM